jgi:hypothetical protein
MPFPLTISQLTSPLNFLIENRMTSVYFELYTRRESADDGIAAKSTSISVHATRIVYQHHDSDRHTYFGSGEPDSK